MLNQVLSLEMSAGCPNYSSHRVSPSLLAGTPASAETQPAQAFWQLKTSFVISAMQPLLPCWQDLTLAHMPRLLLIILTKGSQDGA